MTGKLLIGQAGGATAVINSSLVGILEEVDRVNLFDEVWGMRRGVEGALQHDFIDLRSLSHDLLDRLSFTPGAALGSSRHKVSDDEADQLLDYFLKQDIRYLLYVGGNDSADTVHRLGKLAATRHQELQAIAVPKTIDNDLPVTDHCPGYGSIARYVAVATMDSAKDTESMPTMYPVKVIEVMGRDAGWVAAASTLGKREHQDAPHLVYVPERALSRFQLLADVERVNAEIGHVVIVVTETVRDESGEPFADPHLSQDRDTFGHPLIRGTAGIMCGLIQRELGLRARYDKPGSLQRMSSLHASSVDREEATEVGRTAVRLLREGATDRMVTLIRDSDEPYHSHTDSTALEEVANKQRLLPAEFLGANGTGTTEAFRRYALPLLGPDPFPMYARLPLPTSGPRLDDNSPDFGST